MADDGREGADPRARTQLTEAAGGGLGRTRPVDARAATEELAADFLIDRFVVLDELGRGGMGVVYSARDPDLDRTVAIKLLRFDNGESTNVRARLLREAQAMARIDHPNVIKVFEVGTHGDGVYVAMELAKAGTLRGWLAARHTQREIIAAFVQAGRGLAAAHAVGLIHRDFKPDNVLMTSHETAKVTDFGLVTEQGAEVPAEPAPRVTPLSLRLTRTGAVMGTPAYMAPEQFTGAAATARTDQFAFCVALCEAVAGARPFGGTTFEELGVNVTAGQIIARPAKVPPWLWRILSRGLAIDVAARFPSMDALLAELEQGRWSRRQRVIAGAAAVVIGAAASFGVIAATRSRGSAAPPAMVLRSVRNLTTEPGCEEYPSFTPDGREIVFDGVVDNDLELEAIAIDTGARRRLTHAPGWDLGAAVSPDGRHVAYVHDARELRVVGIEGDAKAPPRTIANLRGFPAWTHDGDLLYGDSDGQIWRASLAGPPKPVARLPPDELAVFIDELPDGEIVVSVKTRDQRTSTLTMAHVHPGGVATHYEPRWEALDSSAIRVDGAGRGIYYVAPTPSGLPKLHWRARDGGQPIVLEGTMPVTNSFAVASAGRRIVFSKCDARSRIGRMTRGGFERLANMSSDWNVSTMAPMPDDRLIVAAFRSADSQPYLWMVTAAGLDEVVGAPADQPAMSPHGEQLAWSGLSPAPGITLRATSGGAIRRLTVDADDGNPTFSGDGTSVLFTRGGRVYSVPVAGGDAVAVTPPGVVAFAAAPDRAELAVLFEEGGQRVLRKGPIGGPFADIAGVVARKYDEVAFDREGMLLGTAESLHELRGDGSDRLLWSSRVEALQQVAPSRTGGDPWAIVTGYDGDLALVEGEFP